MTDEEAAEKIRKMCDEEDPDLEENHYQADKILCNILTSLGYTETVNAFRKLDKWYA